MKKEIINHEKKLSVTIGIPAYNEEENIKALLCCLLRQTKEFYTLKEILVVSDGSTDATANLAASFKNPVITVIENKKRLGQQVAQNVILNLNKSDILIFLEADTLPLHDCVIDALVRPFVETKKLTNHLGIVIGIPVPMVPQCFFEKILVQGSKIKNDVIYRWEKGNNIYVHSGHAMKALSKDFAKKLVYPVDVPEDAFTYMTAKNLGFRIVLSKQAKFGMRHVATIAERIRQVRKYKTGRIALEKYFSEELLRAEYALPRTLLATAVGRSLITNPFLTILYALELALNRLLTMRDDTFNVLYKPYTSSKQLVYEEK